MIHFMGMANKSLWGVGDNNKYPNGVASFLRTTANGGEVNWEKGAGGWENGYIGDGQVAYRKCTAHTRHSTRVGTHVPVGLPWSRRFLQLRDACLTDPMGGVGL